MTLEAGASASAEHRVEGHHTALAVGSGDVEVLATPQLLAWCEGVTVDALAGMLQAEESTVGMRVRLDHVRATPVDASVHVSARLTRVEGSRLTFDVEASDERGAIASGQVVRVVVDRARFMDRATPAHD